MFTPADRDSLLAQLVQHADQDPNVFAAALTGSLGAGSPDRWSDLDLVLGVRGQPLDAARAWADWLRTEHGALHHWNSPSGSRKIIWVFLLPGWMEWT